MPDLHDLAQDFIALAETLTTRSAQLENRNLPSADPGYAQWMADLAALDDQINALQAASTGLDAAYAQEKLAGLDDTITQIGKATDDAKSAIATIGDANRAAQIIAAVVNTAAAVVATIADPIAGAPALVASAAALTDTVAGIS
jgi:hypothetical protein